MYFVSSYDPFFSYIRQFHDEIIGVGLARSLLDLVLCDILSPITDVLGNGSGEQHRFLAHHTYQAPQVAHIQ